jgi:hypothetical protein
MRNYAALVLVTCLALSGFAPAARGAQQTTRISVDFSGAQSDGSCAFPMISADGSRVAYMSSATNLVPGPSSSATFHVYVHDRLSGNVQRASVSSNGALANADCRLPELSATGRYVTFVSSASNLAQPVSSVPHDNVFLRDLSNGTTTLVSVGAAGVPADAPSTQASVSSDGRFVAFVSKALNLTIPGGFPFLSSLDEVYLRDMVTGVTTWVTMPMPGFPPSGSSSAVSISDSGEWVAFATGSTTLVLGDFNQAPDIFLYSRTTATLDPITFRPPFVFLANDRSEFPRVSSSGDFVVFTSRASNLTAGDTNGRDDVFAWERSTDTFRRASQTPTGGNANQSSYNGAISSDGVWVVFTTSATNLIPGDTNNTDDVLRKNLATGAIERLSVSTAGQQGSSGSGAVSCSSDGRSVAFVSFANNLVPGDTNNTFDVFLHGPPCSDQIIYCTAKTNSNGCVPTICSSGRASISNSSQLRITAHRVLNLKSGLFFWGSAPQAAPFFGGTLCVGAPIVRTAIQQSGGNTTTNDCTGSFQFDFTSAYIAASGLAVGMQVYGQWWYRDPFFPLPNNVGLSDGLQFVIEP